MEDKILSYPCAGHVVTWGVKVWFHSFLASKLAGGERPASRPATLPPGKSLEAG